jgi:VCBS repeat-containing protein
MMKISNRSRPKKTKMGRLRRPSIDSQPGCERLEARNLLAGDLWHNAEMPADVNHDSQLTPIDALLVINELNASNSGTRAAIPDRPMFYDVSGDRNLTPVDALLVINALNAEGENGMLVQIRLEVTDLENNPITTVGVGEDFIVRGFVTDLTGRADGGVFAAYLDVNYDQGLVAVDGPISYGDDYPNDHSGNTDTAGVINEVGAFDGFDPLGTAERLLFSIPMTSTAPGAVTFDADPADVLPRHDVLVFGIPEGETSPTVPSDKIMYVDATLTVGGDSQPVAVDDSYETSAGTLLTVDAENGVLANDTDPNGDPLTASVVTTTANGVLTLNANGSFTYTPNDNFTGADTFTYVANDGTQNSNEATVTITVNAENTAPVAVEDTYTVDEDVVLEGTSVLANDTDADEDTLTAVLGTGPENGTLELNADGTFTYTPELNFNGTDSFTYMANDGQADSAPATVTINVTPVNDGPTAVADSYTTPVETALTVVQASGLLANDTDVDGNPLTATVETQPSNGTLTLEADGSFTYTPNAGFSGADTFTYRANDGTVDSDPATVTITVSATDVSVRIILRTVDSEGNPIDSVAPGGEFTLQAFVQDVSEEPREGVFAAYMDLLFASELVTAGGPITYGADYPNTQTGTISEEEGLVDEVGAFDGFDPLGSGELLVFSIPFTADAVGTAVFQSEAADLLPAHAILLFGDDVAVPADQVEYGTVSLTIEEQGEPPTAVDDSYTTDEDIVLMVPVATGVLANDTNPNEGPLTAVLVDSPANGLVTLSGNGAFSYTPNQDFNGTDTFTYRAMTSGAPSSNVATVTITINPLNDAPVAQDDEYQLQDPSGSLIVSAIDGVLANDTDAEGDELTAELVSNPANGTLTFNADGSFTYTPTSTTVGLDTFTYRANAGGQSSEPATVTIEIGDQRPSTLSGFVYMDGDNDGVRQTNNVAFGDVVITLTGTNLLGEDVRQSVRTAADGSYQFIDVLRGTYTITETQPILIIDGKDTINGQLSLRNDRFVVDVPGGSNLTGYNFGERGLQPQFIGNPLFFASRSKNGLFAAIGPSGEQAWYCFDAGWSNLASINVQLSSNGSSAELTGIDLDGNTITNTVVVTGNRNVRVLGDMRQGMLVRLDGTASDFGLVDTGEGEFDPAAVDAAFGEGG